MASLRFKAYDNFSRFFERAEYYTKAEFVHYLEHIDNYEKNSGFRELTYSQEFKNLINAINNNLSDKTRKNDMIEALHTLLRSQHGAEAADAITRFLPM